ncbi:hypothetical protein AAZX31_13G344300 [Glycine max]|uniref:C3H1-type domain-containing protein n=1 Tax=Glycine max TaxID=3847 RepID=K7M3X6_SOYBN|nr:probable E3 ubiquitin-protein ligase makorin-2 [Glycine max]KAG4384939.1 hypothetical protein GLYMA_13G363600v4 [Glycine max]KAG4384940.1 hypothetical protein GLYMA_13G363600v4 [Glycine max]KAG4384941.1 hypothetical protein GLYMA_13G363600v4 [Glycine max]KAG4384942.1 hypothetical protein GLYMA_13G363600v4 [Glycine max]KAG4972620.1 hypothetical protein JHK85_039041 [Glycine max]|eukprot:XP_006595161.1 probable E3 ubiquitin-protein ligase makorin-2 [Glycine max]
MEAQSHGFNAESSDSNKLMVKTEMCRRFRRGVCVHGSKCIYAHSVAELRLQRQPKQCRFFLQNKRCHYGRTCRFLHSSTPLNPNPQPEVGKLDPYSSPESKRMRTCAAAPSDDGCSSAEQRIMQTSAAADAATNASTSTVATKNEPSYPVKFIFKNNDLQRISRIYADWI